MIKASTYGKNCAKLHEALRNRESFDTGGALKGREADYVASTGKLNPHERDTLYQDVEAGITYVVYSYETPIAWVRSDGSVHIVEQRFSVTTTKHQGHLYVLTPDEDY